MSTTESFASQYSYSILPPPQVQEGQQNGFSASEDQLESRQRISHAALPQISGVPNPTSSVLPPLQAFEPLPPFMSHLGSNFEQPSDRSLNGLALPQVGIGVESADPGLTTQHNNGEFLPPPYMPKRLESAFKACRTYNSTGITVSSLTTPQINLDRVVLAIAFNSDDFHEYNRLTRIAEESLQEAMSIAIEVESLFNCVAEGDETSKEQVMKKIRYSEINLPKAFRVICLVLELINEATCLAKYTIDQKSQVSDEVKAIAQKTLMQKAVSLRLKHYAAKNRLDLACLKFRQYPLLQKNKDNKTQPKIKDLTSSDANLARELALMALDFAETAKFFKMSEEEQQLRELSDSAKKNIMAFSQS